MHVHSEELDNSFVAVQDLGSKYKKLVWGCSSTVEHLPHMFEALGSALQNNNKNNTSPHPTPNFYGSCFLLFICPFWSRCPFSSWEFVQ
jgi:hypothetical protein